MYGMSDRLSITPSGVRATLNLPLSERRPAGIAGMQPTAGAYPSESLNVSLQLKPRSRWRRRNY
ncbi:MAG: hypothetical protein ACYCVD_17025 [Desulfitobacteriaceae bacterium]